MTVKQFKRRWLNSKIEPELFYLPVGKKEGRQPFIFEIEVFEDGAKTIWLRYNSSYFLTVGGLENCTLYNLKDSNGNFVTKETHPDLFWEFPYNEISSTTSYDSATNTSTTIRTIKHLSENMVEQIPKLYLNIDWGDGQTLEIDSQKANCSYIVPANGRTVVYSFQDGFDCDCYSDTKAAYANFSHTYEKAGIYRVQVEGYADGFYLDYSSTSANYKLLDIISWGDLNWKCLDYAFCRVVKDMNFMPKIDFQYFKKVISLNHAFYRSQSGEFDNMLNENRTGLHFDWEDIGGDRFFDNFPKLIYANSCFYYSDISYVPDYCFANTPYVQELYTCFWGCELRYVGNYACANLKYLKNASRMFGSYKDCTEEWLAQKFKGAPLLEYFGDSVFENCVSLTNVNSIFNVYFKVTKTVNNDSLSEAYFFVGWQKIGSKVFKNCPLITGATCQDIALNTLHSIGEECFSGCESLTYVFGEGWINGICLQSIGADIFTGCKSLRGFYPLGSILLKEIPDNFLYDVEYTSSSSRYEFAMRLMYDCSNDDNYMQNLSLEHFVYLLTGHSISSSFYQEFFPEAYEKLLNAQKTYPYNIGLHLGKNMFNEEFLSQVQQDGFTGWWASKICFGHHVDIFTYDSDGVLIKWEIYNNTSGEAPPFWKYGINVNLGSECENNGWVKTYENGKTCTYVSNTVQFDNEAEIPRGQVGDCKWIEIHTQEQF